jgi:hypothetical protein
MNTTKQTIQFPEFSGVRCLMMPYIQGEPNSVPSEYGSYHDILKSVFLKKGDIGFLTIDESQVFQGNPHRGARAKWGRAIHTEAGKLPPKRYCWGSSWGGNPSVKIDSNVRILLANNLNGSCAIWNAEHHDTSPDGDIGYAADQYPYSQAIFMKAGEVHEIGILQPHESIPVNHDFNRQFLRIVSSGVHGRADYFTTNPKMKI